MAYNNLLAKELKRDAEKLLEDAVYVAAKDAGDAIICKAIENRTMTKQMYIDAATKYDIMLYSTDIDDVHHDVSLGAVWSEEALALPGVKSGAVVLRPDGKIDFPSLGIKGMAPLTSTEVTDTKERTIVQGDYIDKNGRRGVSGKTYFQGHKAKEVATSQGLKLLPVNQVVDKIEEMFALLGDNVVSQSKALQVLFGSNFTGYFSLDDQEWSDVDSASYVGMSEQCTDRTERTVIFRKDFASDSWFPHVKIFFACESCEV